MPGLQRAVLLRAAAAALALGAALGAQSAVGPALARRGVERAERDASVCAEARARAALTGRQDLGRYDLGRPDPDRSGLDRHDPGWPYGCEPDHPLG
ncbi:hypothetical protein GCM10009639_38110 [Kitasatospora putterlickiae]|uniref:Uncharacterized protein n=1 Tax=Kitasatospora putterlickiae TaxID=221725 RepID=A0ABN1Y657_9ACTN